MSEILEAIDSLRDTVVLEEGLSEPANLEWAVDLIDEIQKRILLDNEPEKMT